MAQTFSKRALSYEAATVMVAAAIERAEQLGCKQKTGCLAQFGQVQWHSPGARIGSDGARKWR